MSGVISALNNTEFENWVIAFYPDLFEDWENEASEHLDLDEWLYKEHPNVIAIYKDIKDYHNGKNRK